MIGKITDGGFGGSDISGLIEQECTSGDKVGLLHESDGTLELWFNDNGAGWSMIGSVNDTTFNCANSFIGIYGNDGTVEVDDFGGGTVGSVMEMGLNQQTPIFFR